ncbi:Membrane proteinase PrsW, cleaves anti-sigma factor RsiW, M82 family [Natronoarchaeum philippinense]|uniref:Membrane proteinase PrsW, cleaves anti-sigma factor RsiW, M82 family n=1 Tax=Natronoarchaeum philippinense TaxID=558529 RepID=A0A285P7D4_NATPI|nr:PrsW family intramembrane metalloprotease [Natronoarchaeum philippinense]SNZ17177.1 Membrane proteinase PrsW, cleaves anti-sigma factor RsiW, M82 family [Natronoarchaeum philippinense]
MGDRRDPLQERADGEQDLYDIATWESRSLLDRTAVAIYHGVRLVSIYLVIGLALLLLVTQLAASGYVIFRTPSLGLLTLLSAVPALALAAFLWQADPTVKEPLGPLAVTFLLAVLFASFAAVVNTVLRVPFAMVPVVGIVLYFFLVVGPIEEIVKLLAVRLYAYRGDAFQTVTDGAVYGAVAGLGFATIENTLYITREFLTAASAAGVGQQLEMAAETATQRAFVGPGHVIYSGFAGYYLGLAKFNPDDAGPIVVKGILTAALIHATYNTLVSALGLPFTGLLVLILVYDGFFGYLLYRKLARYRSAYERTSDEQSPQPAEDIAQE